MLLPVSIKQQRPEKIPKGTLQEKRLYKISEHQDSAWNKERLPWNGGCPFLYQNRKCLNEVCSIKKIQDI